MKFCTFYTRILLAWRRFYSTEIGQPTAGSHPHMLKEGEITPGISSEEYISRRKRILDLLPEKSLAIISASPVKMMTSSVPHFYRQNSDYLYITGCQQPGGVAVLGHGCGLCMFMPEQNPRDIIWHGQIAGVEAARDIFKADQSYPINKIHTILPKLIDRSSNLFHKGDTAIPAVMELDSFRKAKASGKVKDLSAFTDEARWIKSPSELKLMRDSASIGCQALLQSMLHSKVFPHENMLSAMVEYECKMRGAQRMTFHPVVGGGSNGSVIHYSRNDQNVKDGDLVLMDIGCELHGYVSDLTRTWPPCGSFSPIQEVLYELILETNKECIDLCKPGTSIRKIHTYSGYKMRKGLKEIGILENEGLDSYHQLNPTNIGHYLGMDVHDCPTISNDRPLRPGVVITIEPGVYIPKDFSCPERFHGIGIRIEDEVLITESGCEVLTGSLAKEIKHIQSVLNNYQHGSMINTQNMNSAVANYC